MLELISYLNYRLRRVLLATVDGSNYRRRVVRNKTSLPR